MVVTRMDTVMDTPKPDCHLLSKYMIGVLLELLVFSVTPFKIDQNKNQNRSIDKVQNLEMKGGIYTKTLAKIQVRGIFRIRDIRRNVLSKFIEICMETPCWCSPG